MTTLRDEILSGPLAAELAPHVAIRHDAMVAKILNEPRYTVLGKVERAKFIIWAAAGPRAAIEDIATTPGHPLRASALTLKDMVMGGAESLSLDEPGVVALLNAWTTAGAITAEQRVGLEALASRQIGRAEQAGFGVIHHSQVSAALNEG